MNDTKETFEQFLRRLEREANSLVERAATERGGREALEERLAMARTLAAQAGEDAGVLEQVTTLLQGLEAAWQHSFQESVANIISHGLSLVFEEPMELLIVSKVRADVTTVDLKIVQNGVETDIMGAKGGTVIALVNVLVRALLVLSARPPLRRILILDEPFGLADDQYIPSFGELLRELVDRLGFQIIIVSHEAALVDVADFAYEGRPGTAKTGATFYQLRNRNEVRT